MPDLPIFLVIIGPSGAGKSTLIHRFLRCLSVTPRLPRGQEQDGIDYFFVSTEEFERRIQAGRFLEHATVFGKHRYGTDREFVGGHLAGGRSVVKDVDVQGALQIQINFPQAVLVFVTPSDRAEIERRLRGRGTEDEAAIQRRLAEADIELKHQDAFGHKVINDDLELAAADLARIVANARL